MKNETTRHSYVLCHAKCGAQLVSYDTRHVEHQKYSIEGNKKEKDCGPSPGRRTAIHTPSFIENEEKKNPHLGKRELSQNQRSRSHPRVAIIPSGGFGDSPHIRLRRTITIMSTRIQGYRHYLQQLNPCLYPSKLMDYLSALKVAIYKAIFKQVFCILPQLSAISGKVQSQ